MNSQIERLSREAQGHGGDLRASRALWRELRRAGHARDYALELLLKHKDAFRSCMAHVLDSIASAIIPQDTLSQLSVARNYIGDAAVALSFSRILSHPRDDPFDFNPPVEWKLRIDTFQCARTQNTDAIPELVAASSHHTHGNEVRFRLLHIDIDSLNLALHTHLKDLRHFFYHSVYAVEALTQLRR